MNSQEKTFEPGYLASLVAFVLAGISASLSVVAIMIWAFLAEKNMDMEGGPAFAANFPPLMFFVCGLVIGMVAILLIIGSLGMSKKPILRAFTLYHLAGIAMLSPSFYIVGRMLF